MREVKFPAEMDVQSEVPMRLSAGRGYLLLTTIIRFSLGGLSRLNTHRYLASGRGEAEIGGPSSVYHQQNRKI